MAREAAQRSRSSAILIAVAYAAVFALLTAASWRCVLGIDFWWQWKSGQFVAENGPPQVDSYSYTIPGQPYVELRWLYCLIVYLIEQHIGLWAVTLLKWLVITAAFGAALVCARPRLAPLFAAGVLLLSILAASQRFYVRPELASWLWMAVDLLLVDQYRRGRRRALWAVPLVQVVWMATHTTFILGPMVMSALLAAEGWAWLRLRWGGGGDPEARRSVRRGIAVAGAVLCATGAACLINPYGWRGVTYTLRLATLMRDPIYRENITELWGAFSFTDVGVAARAFLVLLALAVVTCVANRRRLDAFHAFVALATCGLALSAVRNLPLFALAALPLVVRNVGDLMRERGPMLGTWLGRARPVVATALALIAGGYAWDFGTGRHYVRRGDPNQAGLCAAQGYFPLAAAEFVDRARLPGPIFSTLLESSALIARGRPVFIDARIEPYSIEHFSLYLRILRDPAAWSEQAARWGFRTAVVGGGSPLVETLWADPNWRLVYFDAAAAVFVRADTPDAPPALRTEAELAAAAERVRGSLPPPRPYGRLGWFERATPPDPHRRVGLFLAARGFPRLALPFLADALAAYPGQAGLRPIYADLLQQAGRLPEALAEFERARAAQPDDENLQYRVANLYAAVGRSSEARALIDSVLQRRPNNADAWAVRAAALAGERHFAQAEAALLKAMELDPGNVQYRRDLEALRNLKAGRTP